MKKTGLTNNALKIIAMLSMLVDHVGLQLFPKVQILRIIGRLALPIFAYMIAEGCHYTKNRPRYLGMIAGLGLICQAVYFFADGSLYLGILITFSLSISTIFLIDNFLKKKNAVSFIFILLMIAAVFLIALILPEQLSEHGFDIDYGIFGILLPVAIYYARNKYEKLAATALVLSLMASTMANLQWYSLFALPLLFLYNGNRGRLNLKYLFYIFYPTHLVIIYLISLFI